MKPDQNAMAAAHTHEVCAQLLDRPPGGPVLDLGAGQGAFSSRLKDSDFDVVAVGISPDQFLLHDEVPYLKCDLDEGLPFASNSLSGIVAIEVLEHLQAPFRLLREAARCLGPNGFLLLTTPNVLNISSRLSYLLKGHAVFFGEKDFQFNGHITPIHPALLSHMTESVGLVIEKVTYNVGKLPIPKVRHHLPLKGRAFRSRFWGEILITKSRKIST